MSTSCQRWQQLHATLPSPPRLRALGAHTPGLAHSKAAGHGHCPAWALALLQLRLVGRPVWGQRCPLRKSSSLLVPRSLEALPVRVVQPPAGVPAETLKSSSRGLTGPPISLHSLQPHPPSGFVPRPSRTQTRSLRSLPWGPSQEPWAVPTCLAGYTSSGLLGHNGGSQ